MGGPRKPIEYQAHPLLDQMKPLSENLKANTGLGILVNSFNKVGQLVPIFVTEDHYIIDGRKRLAVCKHLGLTPHFQTIRGVWSCVDPLPPGYSREEEIDTLCTVLQELHRRWGMNKRRQQRNEPDPTILEQGVTQDRPCRSTE